VRKGGRRVIAVVILLVAFGPTIVAELVGGSYILNVAFGIPTAAGVFLIAGVFIAYTVLGGLFAIAYTDLLQMLVFSVGFAIAVPYAVGQAGGFTALNEKLASIEPTLVANGMPLSTLIASGVSFFILLLGYPCPFLRHAQTVNRRGCY
jgi:Na+/proline symporter